MALNDAQKKFQQLLRELFQFECADLDFGIYRIMNCKRAIIERFIIEDLPHWVEEELQKDELGKQNQVTKEWEAARNRVLEMIDEEALDDDGNLAEKYRETKVGKEYLIAQERACSAKGSEALEAIIYNHLYTFFSRYWQDGDFVSKRRYSKRERYAIPYNGEEVYLYWANQDQYYIKTAEYFTDYTWKAPNGVTVHFKLKAADVEQNNVKGEKRLFLPNLGEITWDVNVCTLTIPFEFRPLTDEEIKKYRQKNQQEAIIAETIREIPKQFSLKSSVEALAALAAENRKNEKGETVTRLEYHLRQYTRRNTSDFFIHKNLKGFLSRELDFYLKNEVLNLDELERAGEDLSPSWFQLLRVIKSIGLCIIDFLAQIEDFQKMLWEKKKFVTETFYCIIVGNIKKELYPEIATCESQWEEWKELFHIDEKKVDLFTLGKKNQENRLAFLKDHPTLVLDTRHFSTDFIDRLLATFENLDELTDGLLVHSENWQALNLLQEKHLERVKQIHIDPPYNTDASRFVYKNDYRHSSWLSMMMERVLGAKRILRSDSTFTCHIDENEYERLRLLLEKIFGYVGTAIWDKLNPMMGAQQLAIQHEYIMFCTSEPRPFFVRPKSVRLILSIANEIIRKYGIVTQQAKKEFNSWVRNAKNLSGGERAYQYLDDNGQVYRLVAMTWPNPKPPPQEFFTPLIHPVTKKPCPVPSRGWSQSPKKMAELLTKGEIVFGVDETTQPQRKVLLSKEKALPSVIRNGSRGKTEIDDFGLDFTYNHPVSLYMTLLDAGVGDEGIILDFFAGSGTTGHAVINLNRENNGRCKFILVEMAHYFNTVLLPRIKKIIFTPEWKDGKPKRVATSEEAERSPRIVKVIRLESYEDALNNIAFNESGVQLALTFEDYLLKYMLHWESRNSETLLNVEKLSKPFDYALHIYRNGEIRIQKVDLPETFNYLIGLDVEMRRVIDDGNRRYLIYRGTTREGRRAVIIWRETEDWMKEDYLRDRDFIVAQNLTEDADLIYINGDSLIPGARALDNTFKARMFVRVEG